MEPASIASPAPLSRSKPYEFELERYKYLVILVFPAATVFSFYANGLLTILPALLFFGLVPVLEFVASPDHRNYDPIAADFRRTDAFYDRFLYLLVALQYVVLGLFLFSITDTAAGSAEFFGRTLSMGMMCGLLGINVGHELGHRADRFQRFLGEAALLTSLENHFLPYHNLGHHRNAATPDDPATARRGEWVYAFWFRSQFGSYLQAWRIENARSRRAGRKALSLRNRMVAYTLAQIGLLGLIGLAFGSMTLAAFVLAALVGKALLETVNYIEHYGLLRGRNADGSYVRVGPEHSWNSDHVLGRAILLELSRHSDHHFRASKPFQTLDSLPQSPQMPTGYPGMMMFSLVAPLFCGFMDRKIDRLRL